jgi:hypothetical protein
VPIRNGTSIFFYNIAFQESKISVDRIFSACDTPRQGTTATQRSAESLPSELIPSVQLPTADESEQFLQTENVGYITSVVTLELCCGSAGLTAQLKIFGFNAQGVNWTRDPSRPLAPILQADLADPHGQELVWNISKSANIQFSHGAPPGGTASRAKTPMPQRLIRAGAPQPRQLRSEARPLGLDKLTPSEQLRVDLANKIYNFAACYMTFCHNSGRPATSYFWLFTSIAAFVDPPRSLFNTVPTVHAWRYPTGVAQMAWKYS